MEPLPNEIYQDIIDFQSDVNRPIDISIYREFKKDAAWASLICFISSYNFDSSYLQTGYEFSNTAILFNKSY